MKLRRVIRRALESGTVASLTSTAALVLAARAEREAALRPTNSTSHWLNGPEAAAFEGAYIGHTAVGYATHHAATVFWALLYEGWVARQRPVTSASLFGGALVVSGIAAAVDYGATPKRFTPGWEFVLSKRSMAAVYGAMAVGLTLAASTSRRRDGEI